MPRRSATPVPSPPRATSSYNLSEYVNPDMASVLPKGGCWTRIVGAAPGASLLALKVLGLGTADESYCRASSRLSSTPCSTGPRSSTSPSAARISPTRTWTSCAQPTMPRWPPASPSWSPPATPGRPARSSRPPQTPTSSAWAPRPRSAVTPSPTRAASTTPPWATAPGPTTTSRRCRLAATPSPAAPSTSSPPGTPTGRCARPTPSSYTDCADGLGGKDIGVENFGGTSEAAPLTAAAAADVIEAYARAHARHRPVHRPWSSRSCAVPPPTSVPRPPNRARACSMSPAR